MQPGQPLALIRPQRPAQCLGGGEVALCQGRRPAQPGQQLAQRRAGRHLHPSALGLGLILLPQVGRRPRQQPHALDERDLPVIGLALQGLPMGDRLIQPLAVHLHPLVAQQHQVVGGVAQRLQLVCRQRAVAERDLHPEIQHRIGAHPSRRLGADRDRDLRPRPLAPPVGDPYRQPAQLQLRHALQEPVGIRGRPGQRAIQVAGVRQRAHPRARLGRLLHRRQQVDQRCPVVGPGILLQGVAQRLVLEPAAGAEAGCIGGKERERPLLVIPVLGQVEADPSHLPPARRPLAQQRARAAGSRGGLAHPLVEPLPQAPQAVGRQIFAALHRRRVQHPGGEQTVVGRLHRDPLGLGRQVAQPGQVVFRKLLPVAQAGDLLRRQPLCRQGKERRAPVASERVHDGSQVGSDGSSLRRRIGLPAQMAARRQSYAHERRLSPAGEGAGLRTCDTCAVRHYPTTSTYQQRSYQSYVWST